MDDGRAREEGTGEWLRQQYFNSGAIPQTPGAFPNPVPIREAAGLPGFLPSYQQHGESARGLNGNVGQYYPPMAAGFGRKANFSGKEKDDPFAFSDQSSNGIGPNSSFRGLVSDDSNSQGQQTMFRGQGNPHGGNIPGMNKYISFPVNGGMQESRDSRFTSYNAEGQSKIDDGIPVDMFDKLQRSRSDSFRSPMQQDPYKCPASSSKTTEEEILVSTRFIACNF